MLYNPVDELKGNKLKKCNELVDVNIPIYYYLSTWMAHPHSQKKNEDIVKTYLNTFTSVFT